MQQNMLKQECIEKSKLRTFILFKDFDEPAAYVRKPLTFQQRRILAKLRLGCLPLRIETGRYTRPKLSEEERTCLVCKNNNLVDISGENEMWFPGNRNEHNVVMTSPFGTVHVELI